MKIAVIAPTYLPARRANTVQVMKMAQALTATGHEIKVYVPGNTNPPTWESLADHYGLQQQFDIEWLPVNSFWRSYDYGLRAVMRSRKWGADFIYTRLPQAAALSSLLGKSTIYEIHDLPQGIIGPRLFRTFFNGRGACRLVVITQSLRTALDNEIGPIPPEPFTLIAPDGVDLARYQNLPAPEAARRQLQTNKIPDLPDSQFTVGYTGHLYHGRGINLILDMAAQLADITFLLVGGDPKDVDQIRSVVNDRSLNNVILTGFIANCDLALYQAACDVLLMPYQLKVAASSGGNIADYLSPMKLFEYLASGRAIISSDLPVLQEVLSDANAVLLPPEDLDAWIEKTIQLRAKPNQRAAFGRKAQMTAQKYSWESRAARMMDFDHKK